MSKKKDKILENFNKLLEALKQNQRVSIILCTFENPSLYEMLT